jgi:hypothetical protein
MTSASAEIPARIWSSVDVAKGVIRAVLDDRDPVPAGDLEKLPPPVQRQRAAGRVLERRDDVEQWPGSQRRELLDLGHAARLHGAVFTIK